jgi:hypothetical protein
VFLVTGALLTTPSLMEFGNTILESNTNLIAFKLWPIKHHIYVAKVILLMDYCFDRNGPRAKERREEILEMFPNGQAKRDSGAKTQICHYAYQI